MDLHLPKNKFNILIMKKLSLILSTFLLIAMFSCKDECEGVECNGGSCIDGTCVCPEGLFGDNCDIACTNGNFQNGTCNCLDGYEGAACDVEERTKFLGVWNGIFENCEIELPFGDPYMVPDTLLISLEIQTNAMDVSTVDLSILDNGSTGVVEGSNLIIEDGSFEVPADTPFPIILSFSGSGVLTTETQLDIDMTFEIAGIDSSCPITLIKE